MSGWMTRTWLGLEAEGFDELIADAEGALRAGPYGQVGAVPLGYGGAGLERRVLDVLDGVFLCRA